MKKLLWYAVGFVIVAIAVISFMEPSIFGLGQKKCYGLGCEQGIEQNCVPPEEYYGYTIIYSICDTISVCVTKYQVWCEDLDLGLFHMRNYLCLSSPLPGECGSK